jgi:hypothetical protein
MDEVGRSNIFPTLPSGGRVLRYYCYNVLGAKLRLTHAKIGGFANVRMRICGCRNRMDSLATAAFHDAKIKGFFKNLCTQYISLNMQLTTRPIEYILDGKRVKLARSTIYFFRDKKKWNDGGWIFSV